MYDLIVVGGGPAGLTATVYAIRKRLNVLLVTKDLGGKTNYRLALPWVEDYQIIKGLEIVNKFRSELEYLDFARHMEPVDKITRLAKAEDGYIVQTRGGGDLQTKAVIIATGTKQQRLSVPGEKEFIMRPVLLGPSYALCSLTGQGGDRRWRPGTALCRRAIHSSQADHPGLYQQAGRNAHDG
jgi:alkyl hydroperoxide reductase subunit F